MTKVKAKRNDDWFAVLVVKALLGIVALFTVASLLYVVIASFFLIWPPSS